MSRPKWVVFPDGAAGLHKIVLADNRVGYVLKTADDDKGKAVYDAAVRIGFLDVPGASGQTFYVPSPQDDIPFTIPQLARELGGKVTDISAKDLNLRTIRPRGAAKEQEPVERVVPVRPEKMGVNAMGENVLSAENGRFVQAGDDFVQEPATGSKARFLRATTIEELYPISGALFKHIDSSFTSTKMDNLIRFAMEPRSPDEKPDFTFDEARALVRDDLVKQLLDASVDNDASRIAWHDASKIATFINNTVAKETRPGDLLNPSTHLMMFLKRLTRKSVNVDFMGSDDLAKAVPSRVDSAASLSVLDLSQIPEGQRLVYTINRIAKRPKEGRTVLIIPAAASSDEVSLIRNEIGVTHGVESIVSLPHVVADGTAGYQDWTVMVFGDARPEPLETLPIAALRTAKVVSVDELLSVEREINRSTERLREFNTGEIEENAKAASEEIKANDHQVPYIAMSKTSEPETMIPYALQGAISIAQGKVMRHMEDTGGVDATVAAALGVSIDEMAEFLSAEQVDGIAMWMFSRDYDMKGFACMDGTGVGKTRVNLGIAKVFNRLAPINGKKRKIFYLTENGMNGPDIIKELHNMGMGNLKVGFLTTKFKTQTEVKDLDGNKKTIEVKSFTDDERKTILESGEMPDDFDIIVSTFSMFNREAYGPNGEVKSLAADWAHKAFDDSVMIIADEAHNAINVSANTGKNILAMREKVPDNQFLSSTATPFKTPQEVLGYSYLLPRNAGDPEEIMNAVVKGREAAQEAFTTMLAEDASLLRRTRSLSSVVFNAILPDDDQMRHNQAVMSSFSEIAASMADASDLVAGRMNAIIQENVARLVGQGRDEQLAIKQVGKLHKASENFGGALNQLTNMLMVCLRVQGVYEQIKNDMDAGVKPVISFDHTMMSLFNEMDVGEDEDLSYLTIKDQIKRIMNRVYTVTVNAQEVDIRTLDAGIRQSSQALEEMIDLLPDMPASPIDWLMDRLAEDGVKCGELSGRAMRFSNGKLIKRSKQDRDKRSVVDKFNSGEIDALFHNKTGATGLSFHAHKDFLDQRPRHTYIIAAFSEVIKMLQGFGRTDRKEQTSKPTINWVMTGLMAEIRFFQQINRRLRILGASVDANRNHPMLIQEVPDFLNKVGDLAFLSVLRNRPELVQRMNVQSYILPEQPENARGQNERLINDSSMSASSIMNLANTAMSRMVMLRDNEQNDLMASVGIEFEALIEELDAKNANPLKPKMIDGEISITSEVIYSGEEPDELDPNRSAFLAPLYLCTGIQKIQGKVFSADDVMAKIERCRRLQGTDGLEPWANILSAATPTILRRHLPEGITLERALANPAAVNNQLFVRAYEKIERMTRLLGNIKPGVTVRMPMIDDLFDIPSSYIITDIIPPKNAIHAADPAAFKIKMVAPGEVTERTVSMKRMMELGDEEVFFHPGFSRGDNPDVRRSFDEKVGTVYERPVQILRGNLLKAIVEAMRHNLGTPCLYKDADTGQMMKGIVIRDKSLDLRKLPVDLRDVRVAEKMIERRRQAYKEQTLIKLYAAPSNEKNNYSVKDPKYAIAATESSIVFMMTPIRKDNYEFYAERPEMYRALFGQDVPDVKTVRSMKTVRPIRIYYNQPGSAERIKAVMEGIFARNHSEKSINLNFFLTGSYREEINEIMNGLPTVEKRAIENAINSRKYKKNVIDEVAEAQGIELVKTEKRVEMAAIKAEEEEEIEWET